MSNVVIAHAYFGMVQKRLTPGNKMKQPISSMFCQAKGVAQKAAGYELGKKSTILTI
jgi:hypothetical protein